MLPEMYKIAQCIFILICKSIQIKGRPSGMFNLW